MITQAHVGTKVYAAEDFMYAEAGGPVQPGELLLITEVVANKYSPDGDGIDEEGTEQVAVVKYRTYITSRIETKDYYPTYDEAKAAYDAWVKSDALESARENVRYESDQIAHHTRSLEAAQAALTKLLAPETPVDQPKE